MVASEKKKRDLSRSGEHRERDTGVRLEKEGLAARRPPYRRPRRVSIGLTFFRTPGKT